MTCFFPVPALWSKEVDPETGKRGITFRRSEGFVDRPLKVPCNNCIGCNERKILDMSIRCVHEKRVHDASSNWMVTLTYDDEHLPKDGGLIKKDVREFLERMWEEFPRDDAGNLFRYYLIGEYGSRKGRAHYHILFFGLRIGDVRHAYDRQGRFPVYESGTLEDLWPSGRIQIDELNETTAKYVCGYLTQKLCKQSEKIVEVDPPAGRSRKVRKLEVADATTGEIRLISEEFVLRSTTPAIGRNWFDKYAISDVYKDGRVKDNDKVMMGNRERRTTVAPPRYYDYLLEKVEPGLHASIKSARRLAAAKLKDHFTAERLKAKRLVVEDRVRRRDERRARKNGVRV